MTRFLMTTALVAAPFAAATPAFADCDQVGGFGAGTVVTCDGVTVVDGPDAVETRGVNPRSFDPVDGEYGNAPDDITVIVEFGATIDTTGTLDLEGDLARAIDLTGSDDSGVDNSGTIRSGDEGIQADDDFTVFNAGLIEAVEKGLDVDKEFFLFNDTTGVIRSTANEAVETGDDAEIINLGVIEAFDDAIQVGTGAYIENWGTIENTQTFADLAADPGLEAQDAIDIDDGIILNYGTIKSTTNAAIDYDPGDDPSLIENYGLITGTVGVGTDAGDTQAQIIDNYGVIEGTEGTALSLGAGDDVLTMYDSAEILGDVDFGSGDDDLIFDMDYVFQTTSTTGLYDGGADTDIVVFENALFEDITRIALSEDVFRFEFRGSSVRLTSWESFVFADGTVISSADLTATVIPLPASVLLFGSAVAGLGLLGRRQRRLG